MIGPFAHARGSLGGGSVTERPPILGRALLRFMLPDGESESIPGDLEEEFREMDPARRRGWYWRQVLGSAAPLTLERWRRGEVLRSILILTATLVPLFAANELWRYLLSCVPMKLNPSRPLWLFAIVAAVELLCVAGAAVIDAKRNSK